MINIHKGVYVSSSLSIINDQLDWINNEHTKYEVRFKRSVEGVAKLAFKSTSAVVEGSGSAARQLFKLGINEGDLIALILGGVSLLATAAFLVISPVIFLAFAVYTAVFQDEIANTNNRIENISSVVSYHTGNLANRASRKLGQASNWLDK